MLSSVVFATSVAFQYGGALPKHGKSYLFLSIMKALLSGEPWLGHFEVSKAQRVVYLVPEVGLRGVMKRLRKLGMVDHLYDPATNPEGRFYIQTLSSKEKLKLDEAALLLAVQGADVFVIIHDAVHIDLFVVLPI